MVNPINEGKAVVKKKKNYLVTIKNTVALGYLGLAPSIGHSWSAAGLHVSNSCYAFLRNTLHKLSQSKLNHYITTKNRTLIDKKRNNHRFSCVSLTYLVVQA